VEKRSGLGNFFSIQDTPRPVVLVHQRGCDFLAPGWCLPQKLIMPGMLTGA